jgi:uncharacterized protein (TIGR03382 family)
MRGTVVDPAELFPERSLGGVQLIAGGDPTLDDDPLHDGGTISAGCAAAGSGGAGSATLAVMVALLVLRRPRRD